MNLLPVRPTKDPPSHRRATHKCQTKDSLSVGSRLERLTEHGLGEAYRRYAGGYVPNLWARQIFAPRLWLLLRSTSCVPAVVQNLHSRHPWRPGSGIPAYARPTIGLPQAMPEGCFIVSGFPVFRKGFCDTLHPEDSRDGGGNNPSCKRR